MSVARRTIALCIGDPNGIGPEIAVKAAVARAQDGPRPVLVGDPFVIDHYRAMLAPDFTLRPFSGAPPRADALDFIAAGSLPKDAFAPGRVDAAAGAATVAYVEAALGAARAGQGEAIVACPHNETAVNASGRSFSGYPELIAQLSGLPEGSVFLMLVGGGLRIVHATLHERIHHALARLTPQLVEAAALAGVEALRALGIARPRIGLFGVNPHAGEGGIMGDDDDYITTPAAKALAARGVDVEGPVGADVMLGRKDFDAFVAMYHDQGHIPVKLVAGRTASALSIGAGVPFSTVGHGSAFDIAGRGTADPEAVLRTLSLLAGAAPAAA
jgi:4-hydroxy-L-threonine phosphate dehydrogenase PdxA